MKPFRSFHLILLLWGSVCAQETITLSDAYAIAVAKSPSAEAAQERIRQAEARWRQARSQNLPSLALSGSGSRITYSDRNRGFNPGLDEDAEVYGAAAQATWLLFNGGQRLNTQKALRSGYEASVIGETETLEQLAASVSRAYFAAQLAIENQRIASSDLVFNEQQLRETKTQVKAGQRARADELNFAIRCNTAASSLERAQAEVAEALILLNTLLAAGDGMERQPGLIASNDQIPTMPTQTWEEVKTRLPSLNRLREQVSASELEWKAARGSYAPAVRVSGTYAGEREEDPSFSGDDFTTTVGVSMEFELFDAGLRRNRLRELRAAADEQALLLEQAEQDAEAEWLAARTSLAAARTRSILDQENTELARENRDLVEKTYNAGRASLLRLNEAQRDLINSEARATLSRIEVQSATIRLALASGELGTFIRTWTRTD